MKRILFVDDEQHVLDGLRASLRKRRKQWKMVFAQGGEAGLSQIESDRFDVLVTDMRMPKVDGATLLRRAQELQPEMIRIVLSGYCEQETVLRALPVAHQFLSKPCEAATLENTIERACDVQQLLDNSEVRAKIGSVDSLPALPRNYQALNQVLADEYASIDQIAKIIERDIGMSAKLLQLVNSAFFGLTRRLRSVRDAITYLGLHLIKNLVLSIEIFGTFEEKDLAPAVSLDSLHEHSLLVSRIARRLIDDPDKSKDAFAAAMVHDLGKLVLAAFLPDMITASVERAEERCVPLHVAELELHGFGHAEVGAYLLGRWGLPYPLVEAVAFHHCPSSVKHRGFELITAVHVADALAAEIDEDSEYEVPVRIDIAYLERLGVASELPTWWEMARAEVSASEGEI